MDTIYEIQERFHTGHTARIRPGTFIEMNFWGRELITRDQFEEAAHELIATDDEHDRGTSDQCPDICRPETAIWTIPEQAWDWLADLENGGCRIAHDVRVERGTKQFKLVHAAPILDLFDAQSAGDISVPPYFLANVEWNSDRISWVRRHVLYEWDGKLPPMFQVLYHNRNGAEYRGSKFGLSGKTFVSSEFKHLYESRNLTGLEFFEVRRSKRT